MRVRAAFKEWAVIVDALGRGEQIIILRKGGISEGRGGFKLEQSRFFLFPTLFHQQNEMVIPSAQKRFKQIAPEFPPADKLQIKYFAEVVDSCRLESLSQAHALRGQHVWRDEVIADRFDWGRDKAIFALAVKVFSLLQTVELPMAESYGGCKSWIDLEKEIATEDARPVLAAAEFEAKLRAFKEAVKVDATPLAKSNA